jgi:hypothetical protein
MDCENGLTFPTAGLTIDNCHFAAGATRVKRSRHFSSDYKAIGVFATISHISRSCRGR